MRFLVDLPRGTCRCDGAAGSVRPPGDGRRRRDRPCPARRATTPRPPRHPRCCHQAATDSARPMPPIGSAAGFDRRCRLRLAAVRADGCGAGGAGPRVLRAAARRAAPQPPERLDRADHQHDDPARPPSRRRVRVAGGRPWTAAPRGALRDQRVPQRVRMVLAAAGRYIRRHRRPGLFRHEGPSLTALLRPLPSRRCARRGVFGLLVAPAPALHSAVRAGDGGISRRRGRIWWIGRAGLSGAQPACR
jgi:hypothetical protein